MLEAGVYTLLRSLMLVDPLDRRLALEKLILGNMTIEWSTDRQRRQTFGKGQERELHPDNLLKRKKTGPFFEHWQKGLALGQELWLPGRVLPYKRLMGMPLDGVALLRLD